MSKNKKAFTLIELLVAMAIIGVLIGLAIFGLSATQRAARDTERRNALSDINIGVQSFYEKYGMYPTYFQVINNSAAQSTIALCNAACNTTLPLPAVLAAGLNQVNVPLKGAAKPSAVTNTQFAVAAVQTDTTTTQTGYCMVDSTQITVVGSNLKGFAICAWLETGSIYCLGTGAGKGNTLTCGGATRTIGN